MFEHAGGVQQLVAHLADGLKLKGHSVKIITPRPAGFQGEAPEDYILLGTSTKFNPGLGTVGTWTFDVDDKEVKHLLDQQQFDVINFHEPWAPILARQIASRSSEAHVGTFHANLVDSSAAKYLVNMFTPYGRGISKKMQLLTAVSPAPAAVLLNKVNGQNEEEKKLVSNIKYIPNGIDLKVYKPLKKRTPLSGVGTKTILYVGRLEGRKGVSYLINAFAGLVKEMPHTYLLVAGEGKHRRQLEQAVATGNIPNVNFLGYVSDEQKRHLMGNADIVCAPAMYGESFGIVLIEAMAMGTPVIAGNNLGYRTVLRGRGRLGLIDAKSTEDFANRMSVILSDDAVWNLLHRWGINEVKQYDYPRIVDHYEAAYKEALDILTELNNGKKEPDERRTKKIIRRVFVRRHA